MAFWYQNWNRLCIGNIQSAKFVHFPKKGRDACLIWLLVSCIESVVQESDWMTLFSDSKASAAPVNSITVLQCRWIEECTRENLWFNSINFSLILLQLHTDILMTFFSLCNVQLQAVLSGWSSVEKNEIESIVSVQMDEVRQTYGFTSLFYRRNVWSEKNRQSHNALLLVYMCVRLWVDLFMFCFILSFWCALFLSSGTESREDLWASVTSHGSFFKPP